MQDEINALQETYDELAKVIEGLVECYAIPHTRMCMRWSKPTLNDYREEVVSWLRDYAKSFRRLPKKALPGRDDLQGFARRQLEDEISRILAGQNLAVERSFEHLFG